MSFISLCSLLSWADPTDRILVVLSSLLLCEHYLNKCNICSIRRPTFWQWQCNVAPVWDGGRWAGVLASPSPWLLYIIVLATRQEARSNRSPKIKKCWFLDRAETIRSLLFFQSDFGAKLQNVKCFASCVDLWKFACLRFLSKFYYEWLYEAKQGFGQ